MDGCVEKRNSIDSEKDQLNLVIASLTRVLKIEPNIVVYNMTVKSLKVSVL